MRGTATRQAEIDDVVAWQRASRAHKAAFMTQGIEVEFKRGKERLIGVRKTGSAS